jgi:tRNA dimethylallyltransferase
MIVIAGPTASGKSDLAVRLANRFDGEIVNADSMQVYCEMDVGTAKPTMQEREGIPHHLLDVVYPHEEFNAALYRNLAVPRVKDITSRGKACFLVGGTGLYIKTLMGGLFPCPPSDPKFREELRLLCDRHGSAYLHQRLEDQDPGAARKIHPNDQVRIIRALEIIHLTHKNPSSLIRDHGFQEQAFNTVKICLQEDRETLYKKIDARTLAMIDQGLLEETKSLIAKGYSPELKSMKSIGYRHMVDVIKGVLSLEKAVRQLQRDTRRYAKRQLTWFRSDPEMHWKRPKDLKGIVNDIEAFLLAEIRI